MAQTLNLDLVLIIDSSSSDETAKIACAAGFDLHVIDKNLFDHGGTRNIGIEVAHEGIIIFITQDVVFVDNTCLEKLVASFNDNSVAVAYGRQLPHDDATFFARELRKNNYPPESAIVSIKDKKRLGFRTFFCSNSFSAYRVSALNSIGKFKNNLLFGEDAYATALMLLKGYKKYYNSFACVKHSHNYSIFDEFKRYFDVGVFHKTESWMIKEYGSPISEGQNYVKNELIFLFKQRLFFLVFSSIIRNTCKLIGYKLGTYHNLLPFFIIQHCTMNFSWWIKQKGAR